MSRSRPTPGPAGDHTIDLIDGEKPPLGLPHGRSIGTMVRLSLPGLGRQVCLAGSVIAVACLAGGIAAAQGKLDARYTATLTGVPIGKGAWVIEIAEDQYTAAASGGLSNQISR